MVFWALQKVKGRRIVLLLGWAALPSAHVLEACGIMVVKDLVGVTRGHSKDQLDS